ncbi:MAG: beta/gamma crystallin-related protein [Terricaulis sp.]
MALQRPMARIVLYDNNTFRGRNIGITQNTPDLGRRRFSDLASAARSQGGVWELCTEPNYGGTCVTTDTDLVLGAAGVDNTIASVRLIRP